MPFEFYGYKHPENTANLPALLPALFSAGAFSVVVFQRPMEKGMAHHGCHNAGGPGPSAGNTNV